MTNASRMSDRRVQTACLLILTLISIGVALWLLQPGLVPFVLALFFSQCLAPVIKFLMYQWRLPQMVAVGLAVLLAGGLLTGVGFILASSLSGVSDPRNFSQHHVIDQFHRLEDSRAAHMIGIRPSANTDQYVTFFKDKAVEWVTYILSSVATVVKNGASVLLLMAFMLFGRRAGRRLPGGII
jgi:predicted PurR-regulated permease PerM